MVGIITVANHAPKELNSAIHTVAWLSAAVTYYCKCL